jgi:hypothetical protein
MATRRTKNSESERLDDASIERVIALLEPKEGKAGTKKDACAILGIAYNTSRLGSLIEKYKENKAKEAARRAEKRGTPASKQEVNYVITAYLEGTPVDTIASALYRGTTFVKSILATYAVPIRQSAHSYFKPELVPDEACRDRFNIGERVYSMRYDSLAVIKSEFSPGVYSMFLLADKWQQFAYQPAYELASLEHLRKAGIEV